MEYLEEVSGKVKDSIDGGYEFKLKQYLNEGWEIYSRSMASFMILIVVGFGILLGFGLFVGFTSLNGGGENFLFWIIENPTLLMLFSLVATVVFAPLNVGAYLIAHENEQNRSNSVKHFFDGYKDFGQLAIAAIILSLPATLLSFIGLPQFVIIIVGLLLGAVFVFSSLLITVNKYNFRTALTASAALTTPRLINVIGLFVLIILLNVAGAIVIGLGLIVTIPYSTCIIYAYFKDVCIEDGKASREIEDNLILD